MNVETTGLVCRINTTTDRVGKSDPSIILLYTKVLNTEQSMTADAKLESRICPTAPFGLLI